MSKRTSFNQLKVGSIRVTLLLFILLGVIIFSSPKPSHALVLPPVQIIFEGNPLVGYAGVTVSPNGQTLYVGDAFADTIYALPSSGGSLTPVNVGTLGSPTGLVVSPDGNTIYANLSYRGLAAHHPVVVSLPASGGPASIVANLPATPGPSGGLAIYPEGATLVVAPNYPRMALYRVVIVQGDLVSLLVGDGFDFMADVRVSPDSRWLYLGADGNNRLLKVSNDGGVPTPIPTGIPFADPVNIALSPDGKTMYVLDPNIRVNEAGAIVTDGGWPGAIFVGPADGGQFYLLYAGLSEYALHGRITTSPDGKTLYFGGVRRSNSAPVILSIPLLPFTFQVNSTADPGDGVCDGSECTLREAIVAANSMPGANTILVPAGNYTLNVPHAGEDNALTGDLDITGDLVIEGDAASTTIIDANELGRIFHIAAHATVKIKNLTMQNGFAGDGGGIFNAGTLHLLNSTVTGNRTDYEGPEYGGNEGGGIYNTGTLSISNSQLTDNTTDRGMGDGGGGAIMNEGVVQVTRSYFSHNWAAGGGVVFNRGGEVTLTDCTLFTNWARFFGGAVENINGGNAIISKSTITGSNDSIYNNSGATLLLLNSTVSHNVGYRVAGGINAFGGTVQIINSTISYNSGNGSAPGGIAGHAFVSLAHSIVAHNSEANCGEIYTSLGYNLDSDGSCGFSGVGDLIADPLLGPLQNNGGQTSTHALLPGSPAIDAVPPGVCLSARDQRNVPRPQDGNGDNVPACDAGAFELRP